MFEHWVNKKHRKDIYVIVRQILHELDMEGVQLGEFDENLINRLSHKVYRTFY